MALKAQTFEAMSLEEAVEFTYERNWTDGLPVIPPTRPLIEKVLACLKRDPLEVVGVIPPKNGVATVEKIAINCVMAGCKPEYAPVVIAAVEAMLEDPFNLNGVQATTHCCSPLVIVSGPAVKALGFNSRENVFGGGSRANATVGRAVRLIMWNIGGGYAGEIDRATFGHPGKYTYCIAEDPEWNPWEPLHVERAGLKPEQSAVTVFACEAPHHIGTSSGYNPVDRVLFVLADAMSALGSNNIGGEGDMLLILGPMTAKAFAQAGYSKADVKRALIERAGKPVRVMRVHSPATAEAGPSHWSRRVDSTNDDALVPMIRKPENLILTVAGGWGSGAGFCAFCPGWGSPGGLAQTKPIRFP